MSKRSNEEMCDGDSSDDEFYFESAETEDNNINEIILNNANKFSNNECKVKIEVEDEEKVFNKDWYHITKKDLKTCTFTSGLRAPGPQTSANCTEPIEFFRLFFTDELIGKLVEETNYYAKEKIAEKHLTKRSNWMKWTDVTAKEMCAFLGIILNIGTLPLPNLKEYWSTEANSRIPYFGEVFRRDRFMQIYWMLQVNRATPHATSRTHKITNYLEYIDNKCGENFVPGQQLSVDEAVVNNNGRLNFIKYNPQKPSTWGIRLYVLVDANVGYIQSILPYFGSLTTDVLPRPNLPIGTRIILQLYENLLHSNPAAEEYHIYTDRIRYITKLGTCGSAIEKKSGRKTRVAEGEIIHLRHPSVVINNNKYLDVLDKAHHCVSTYCFMRQTQKWWRKLFYWGLEISAINSYILYKVMRQRDNKQPMPHFKFVRQLVDQLVGDFREGNNSIFLRRSTFGGAEGLNGCLHIMRKADGGRSKDCVVCSNRRVKGGRRESRFYCDTCTVKPALHVGECFEKYHTINLYKTTNL